jgi:hypothetical protein
MLMAAMTDSMPAIPAALVLLIGSPAFSEGITTTYADSRGKAIAFPSVAKS